MITITKQKPLNEIKEMLKDCVKIYIIGCGNCAAKCHTGGEKEVLQMQKELEVMGKTVVGSTIILGACNEVTKDIINKNAGFLKSADCILVMSCAHGLYKVTRYIDKAIYPALDTLFVGVEETPGNVVEVCSYCGNCVVSLTTALCPVIRCAKASLNGPCGGSSKGKCELSLDIPCVWQMIYDRLSASGQLHRLDDIVPPKDWDSSQSGGPRKAVIVV